MKGNIRRILYFIAYPLLLLGITRKFFRIMHHFSVHYEDENICRKISPELKVQYGPFKDMKYAKALAAGSALLPKLTGTYEDELHPFIETMISQQPELVIDIGCAEGYYANGIAMRLPDTEVWAIDTDTYALELCKQNAIANHQQASIKTNTTIDFSLLPAHLSIAVICDCEGYEKELFDEQSIPHLTRANLLIELHDCNDDEISKILLPRFEKTHQLTLIKSNPKKKCSDYPHLNKYQSWLHDRLLDERNGIIMYWAFLESKILNSSVKS